MPADGRLQVLGGRVHARVERDLEHDLLRSVRTPRSLWHDVAEVAAERDLLVVVETDLREQQDAVALEGVAALGGESRRENVRAGRDDPRSDAGSDRDEAIAHRCGGG